MDAPRIDICLGSSCFARGGGRYPELVQRWLEDRGLVADVRGHRCATACERGPQVQIDGVDHHVADPAALVALLEQRFSGI